MAKIRFLDGKHANKTTTIDDKLLLSGGGRYRFDGRHLTSSRRGKPYYLKPADETTWADPTVAEWTAALDEGADVD